LLALLEYAQCRRRLDFIPDCATEDWTRMVRRPSRKEIPMKLNRREFVQTTTCGLAAATSKTVLAQVPPAARPPARNRVITLDAKPEPITIDIAKTAVIVVDMQNDFGTKGGMFDLGGIDISQIQAAVGPTSKVISSARRNGIKIVYLKMAFRPDLSDLGSSDSKNRLNHMRLNVGKVVRAPDGRESRILIRDTWNTEIVKELTPHADDVVVYKHRFSGFFQTELDATLKKPWREAPDRDRLHDECVRRVDGQRRDVQRLHFCGPG
jgi:nicotinamidase-related amidase